MKHNQPDTSLVN